MDTTNVTRIKLLKLWELLCSETDSEHPMSTTDIIRRLSEDGISLTRKTLYRDIATLNENGFEVLCDKSQANLYYVASRTFELSELHILMDALQAAAFIPERKTAALISKVAGLSGNRSAELLKRNVVRFNVLKTTNEAILYSVNEIITAIEAHKKVVFRYFDYGIGHERVYRRDGHHYIVSPFATVFSDDQYYLLCYDNRFHKMLHYRVDRMDSVSVSEKDAEDPPEDFLFSVSKHRQSLFRMFSGDTRLVTFSADRTLSDVIFDRFGAEVTLKEQDDNTVLFSAEVQISPTFFGWCAMLGDELRILSPAEVADRYRAHLNAIFTSYTDENRKGNEKL